jgi:nickel-type superoxide dismutase maturation protease
VRAERYHALRYPTLGLFMAGLLLWWWRRRPFRVEVRGDSMAPSLRDGDWLLAIRPGRIHRGDVVVVEHPERPGFELVKRVAGVPGDRMGDRVLASDEFWLVGDHEVASSDSRSFGPVNGHSIRGVVPFRFAPVARAAFVGRIHGSADGSFDRFAAGYERLSRSDPPTIREWLARRLPERGERALDAGCGAGRHTEVLAERFDSVTAVDVSGKLICLARAYRPRSNVTYEATDLLDVTDETGFDLVFSSTALHHLPDLRAALDHLRGLVRSGGAAILIDCVSSWPTPPRFVYRMGSLREFPRDARRLGWHEAWWRYRFKTSAPWLDHLQQDRYLTTRDFERRYGQIFPGAWFERVGGLHAMVWRNDGPVEPKRGPNL